MKFYGQGNPPVDKILYESYFKDTRDGVFIECGAVDGILESSCKFFEESLGWSGLNLEPVPFLYERLLKNRPRSINLNFALSNRARIAEFKHAIHPTRGRYFGNGSLKHKPAHLDKLKKQGCVFETFDVNTVIYTDLEDLFHGAGWSSIDLFVLDVEGHEDKVIQGMMGSAMLPKIMCVEHTHTKNLNGLMRNLGYSLDQKVAANSYYIKG